MACVPLVLNTATTYGPRFGASTLRRVFELPPMTGFNGYAGSGARAEHVPVYIPAGYWFSGTNTPSSTIRTSTTGGLRERCVIVAVPPIRDGGGGPAGPSA